MSFQSSLHTVRTSPSWYLWGHLIELEQPTHTSTLFLETSPLWLLASISLYNLWFQSPCSLLPNFFNSGSSVMGQDPWVPFTILHSYARSLLSQPSKQSKCFLKPFPYIFKINRSPPNDLEELKIYFMLTHLGPAW